MSLAQRRKEYSEALKKRTQESYDTRDDSGRFKSIFEANKMQGILKWKPSEDDHSINIIPYIAGENNPKFKKGTVAYYLDVWIHRAIGVNEDSFICMNRTYGKRCPICDYIAEMKKSEDYDEEYLKSLNPTRRAIYNIQVLDNTKEREKGVQIWDVSHFLFEKEIAELAKKKQGGGFVYFSDPDNGKIVSFRKKGERQNTKYTAFTFEDRNEIISDELLGKAVCLEELLHIPSEDEISDAFFGKENSAPEGGDGGDDDGVTVNDQSQADDVNSYAEDECPCGQTFGVDFNQFENCDECINKTFCEEKKNELDEEARKAKETVKPAAPIARRRTEQVQAPEKPSKPEPVKPTPRRRVR